MAYLFQNKCRVTFEVDPQVYDEGGFTADTFAPLGITDYWALDSDEDWSNKPGEFPSPYHKYCTELYFGKKGNGFEVLDRLSRTAGITQVLSVSGELTGSLCGLTVENTSPQVFDLQTDLKEQVVAVTAQSSEQGMISFRLGTEEKATRQVIVYELGDLTGDAEINAKDALQVLKSAVQKTTLESFQTYAAEVTGDGKIDAKDALEILKYTVGKITVFPIDQPQVTPTDVA